MNSTFHKKDFWGQFVISFFILFTFLLNFLKIVEELAILGLYLLPVIGIWQFISAMYNTMSCEDSFLKKYLNMYWALTVPLIIIFLLQYAELLGANNILMIGTILFSLIICLFYLYIQYRFLYKKGK